MSNLINGRLSKPVHLLQTTLPLADPLSWLGSLPGLPYLLPARYYTLALRRNFLRSFQMQSSCRRRSPLLLFLLSPLLSFPFSPSDPIPALLSSTPVGQVTAANQVPRFFGRVTMSLIPAWSSTNSSLEFRYTLRSGRFNQR